jgi:chemotaxis protein CheC
MALAAEQDRLRELLNIGAGHAAGAFAQIVGRAFWMEVPRIVERDRALPSASSIVFELEGSLRGVVALLIPAETRDALTARLLGGREAAPELAESALLELGNIVVSHVCSAIADTLAATLMPSVPELVADRAALARRRAGRRLAPLRVETEIVERDGELRGLLVFLPAA